MSGSTIDVHSCMVNELFEAGQPSFDEQIRGKLVVPDYQRPYSWGCAEIDKLISDLKDHFEDSNNDVSYYLGSLILHKSGDELCIIDGQQRLTTLAIIHWLKKNSLPSIQYSSPVTRSQIVRNIDYLKKKDLPDIDFGALNFTLVITYSEDEAYTFFETQNTGGVRLGGEDIIKAHHLRIISEDGGQRDHFASLWESQKNVREVVRHLLQIRSWSRLQWQPFPKNNYKKKYKDIVIKEFSEKASRTKDRAYRYSIMNQDTFPEVPVSHSFVYTPRQPLSSGQGFVRYLAQFTFLYKTLFTDHSSPQVAKVTYEFIRQVLGYTYGLQYIIPLYEKALMCYACKFGFTQLYAAALHLHRVVFSIRVRNEKTVREDSIPVFLRDVYNVLDKILYAHDHEELIEDLLSYEYTFNSANLDKGVKQGYVVWVEDVFQISIDINQTTSNHFDQELLKSIERKIECYGAI